MNFANLDVAPSYAVWTASFTNSMNLQTDESLRVGLELFLVDEVGYLVAVDPGLDAGTFGEDAILVPYPVLEMLVRLELVLGGHPSTAGFAIDVTGLGTVPFGCLDLDLWSVHPAELVPSFLFLVVQGLGLGANLHARVKFVVDQLDLELELKISVELVLAKEGVWTAFLGRAKDCSILDDISGGAVLLCPPFKCLAVKDGLEFTRFVMLGVEE